MRIVVIGNGMVGNKFCEKLIKRSPSGFQITVFGEELRPAYDRVHLSDYFSGKSERTFISVQPDGMPKTELYFISAILFSTSIVPKKRSAVLRGSS